VKLSDSESRRGSAGVRVTLEDLFSRDYPVALNLTARAIEEFDGESRISIVNTGPLDAPSTDKFDDTLFQLTGGLSVTNAPKTLNGYFNVDAVTGDDYDSLGVSAGFRYQW
jgi:outer membrane autotransporter protein